MKECSKGHLYPDTLTHCPVCNRHTEFQTLLGSQDASNQVIHKPTVVEDQTPINKVMYAQTPEASAQVDNDKTVFMNVATNMLPTSFIVGWLIELDFNEMPVLSHTITNNKNLNIGRNNDNDIVLNNKTISRYHAKLEYKSSRIIIHDQNSSNGVIINNKKITSQSLADNSAITLGDVKCLIKYSK